MMYRAIFSRLQNYRIYEVNRWTKWRFWYTKTQDVT